MMFLPRIIITDSHSLISIGNKEDIEENEYFLDIVIKHAGTGTGTIEYRKRMYLKHKSDICDL